MVRYCNLPRFVRTVVSNGLGYDSRSDFDEVTRRKGLLGRFYSLLEGEAVRTSRYALKAHLANMEYRSKLGSTLSSCWLLRNAPEDHDFALTSGESRKFNAKERNKLRRRWLREMKMLKRSEERFRKLAEDETFRSALRTGKGLKMNFLYPLVECAQTIPRRERVLKFN